MLEIVIAVTFNSKTGVHVQCFLQLVAGMLLVFHLDLVANYKKMTGKT